MVKSFVLLQIVASLALTHPAEAAGEKQPFHVPTDGANWLGNDGTWSTLTARLGNPPQPVFLLAGTSTAVTTVSGSQWCSNGTAAGYSCDQRGRAFDKTTSTTWRGIGQYNLNIRPELTKDNAVYGVTDFGYGEYGRDTVKFVEGGSEVKLDDQVVAIVNDSTILLGSLGLGTEVRSFSNGDSYEGLLTTLYKTGVIPSRSYGYTAGNYHRSTKSPVDLVLGGHNTGQYQPNPLTFKLDANYRPVTTLETVSVSATGNPPWGPGSQDLLITPINVQIDSSTPYIWLPEEACRRFEQNLGLTWNSTSNLYLIDDATHDKLDTLNLSFHFTLSAAPGDSQVIEINVSYAAFDLEIGWPFVNQTNKRKYFPLKRASTDEQVTLGRAFLQEAYLIVDHERGNFSVHQTLQKPTTDKIVPIYHPTDTPPSTNGSSKSISTGAIAGIAVGAVILVILIAIGIFFFIRRHRATVRRDHLNEATTDDNAELAVAEAPGEFSAIGHYGYKPRPLSDDGTTYTSPATTEMPGDEPEVERHEMSAVNLNPAELDSHQGWSFIGLRGNGSRSQSPPTSELPDTPRSTLIGSTSDSAAPTDSRPGSHVFTPLTARDSGSTTPWSPMSPVTPDSQAARERSGRF